MLPARFALLAPGRGFSASSVDYGTAGKNVYSESFLTGACPIVGSYGAKDRVTGAFFTTYLKP